MDGSLKHFTIKCISLSFWDILFLIKDINFFLCLMRIFFLIMRCYIIIFFCIHLTFVICSVNVGIIFGKEYQSETNVAFLEYTQFGLQMSSLGFLCPCTHRSACNCPSLKYLCYQGYANLLEQISKFFIFLFFRFFWKSFCKI